MIWVVIANSSTCRIYHFDKHAADMSLLKEINHPELKLKKSEYFTSDKPGKYKNDGSTGGAYSQETDPKAVEVDNFTREIAHELNKGRTSNAYKNLIIITPSHLNGILSKHLDKHVKDLVKNEIQKDVMHLSPHELVSFVKENMLPS